MLSGYMFDKQILSLEVGPAEYITFFNFCRFLSAKKETSPEWYKKWHDYIKIKLPDNIFNEFENTYITNAMFPSGVPQEFAYTKNRENIKYLKEAIEIFYREVIPDQFKELAVDN